MELAKHTQQVFIRLMHVEFVQETVSLVSQQVQETQRKHQLQLLWELVWELDCAPLQSSLVSSPRNPTNFILLLVLNLWVLSLMLQPTKEQSIILIPINTTTIKKKALLPKLFF